MSQDHTVIVVPCYNEARRLDTAAFLQAVRAHPRLHFLFVDDGSQDGTDRVLQDLEAREPSRLHWLKLSRNSGKAEAVRQGMQRAFAMNPRIAGFLDADLATPIAEIVSMESIFEDEHALVALASRVAMLGRHIERSAWRHYTGRLFATLASLTLGLIVYDTQCGAKLFRNTAPVRGLFDREFMSSWAFDVEILARLQCLEREGQIRPVTEVVVEVPLRRWTDVRGSKISLVDSIVATSQLLQMRWRYRSGKRDRAETVQKAPDTKTFL